MLSLVLIVRLPINAHFGIALVGTALFSIILNVLFYGKLTSNSKEEKYLKSSNEDLINITSNNFRITLITLIMSAIIAVAAFAFYNLSTTISVALGIISTLYTSQFLIPYLWAMAYKRRVKKQKENKEVVEVQE